MTPRAGGRGRHKPQRTCVGCREVGEKRELIRVVRGPDGVAIDPTGRAPGRGAYLHGRRSCWERALKGSLAHALRVELSAQDRKALEAYMENLADEQNG